MVPIELNLPVDASFVSIISLADSFEIGGYVMKTQLLLASTLLLIFGTTPVSAIDSIDYADITLSGGSQTGHFPDSWDLTAGDMTLTFTYDGNGLVDDSGAHAWAEFGVRSPCDGDFNPTWMAEGSGVWLATDYDWTANTFDPDVIPNLDLDDKLILQKGGGMAEGAYNLPSIPPAPGNNHRFWFDRDGVDPWQNPTTANTGGIYQVVITLQATSATTGTAYMTINGLAQGFETDGNWNTIELTPAGMTFTGDMEHLLVFFGIYGYGATHSVAFEDITVEGFLGDPPMAPCNEALIDIKPGSDPNSINPKSKGQIPVAILSTPDFDAPNQVDPDTVTFGRTGDEDSLAFCNASPEDVNGDGLDDLVCHYFTQETGFQAGDEAGFLKGFTIDGEFFWATDTVNIVPK